MKGDLFSYSVKWLLPNVEINPEFFLDTSIPTENNNLKISGYKIVRADHPNNVKRRGVCAYVRESLPDHNFSNSYLS